jgi:hypothetical protein|tara:strand:- start:1279 stop:1701 length:423 start_codon:yes stop_codon:yes gene_type:complete
MANRNFEVSLGTTNIAAYVRANGGKTAQCRSFLNDKTYLRVNRLIERKYKVSLSMDRCQTAARHAARKLKADYGTKIQDNAQLTMGFVLKWAENEVKGKNANPIDIFEFGVQDITSLLCKINKPLKLDVKPRRFFGRKSA